MSTDHATEVERAFTTQAEAFEDASRNQVFTSEARWVFHRLPVGPEDLILDVAAGTGHAARQLAPAARAVVALDATSAMLARGHAQADADGITNVVFVRGEASALPFVDASFDIVVCRFAAHHFEAPGAVVAEMARCVRPGGHVALVDLVADADPATAAAQNRLERLRDPSHTRMLSAAELADALTAAGLTSVDLVSRALERPLEPWLDQAAVTVATAAQIREELDAELAGGAVTGFAPRRPGGDGDEDGDEDGELWFTQTFASAIARRPGQ
jgi:ubiquinone/menaquinone biosynthesis C-methylase UbiE